MNRIMPIISLTAILFVRGPVFSQSNIQIGKKDSLNAAILNDSNNKLDELTLLRIVDSVKREELQLQINSLKANENLKKEELQKQLQDLREKDAKAVAEKRNKIDSLRNIVKGFPVLGVKKDTLFFIYSKMGSFRPQERATSITAKIYKLYEDDFLKIDSIVPVQSENTIDIVYKDMIVMSVSESDAIWNNKSKAELTEENTKKIKESIQSAKSENRVWVWLLRIGLVILVIAGILLLIWLINKGHKKTEFFVLSKKNKWLRSLTYKDYTFITVDQELKLINFILKLAKWFFILVLLYLVLPIIFSIFPFTRGWANILFKLVWSPFKGVLISIWNFVPNLFSIIVIYIVFRYSIRFVKYAFSEIESGNLKISGFHEDWAMPTFSIVRFLLYAFMFVLIFPYLPGSDSNIFKGVSVFIGVLFSLGSTSAISNIVAGLVITYMRPFKIGDRIKIGDMTGDVIEKNMLVTRLRTIKNEEITIPNSAVLSGNTINFSSMSKKDGLIIHTTVTIGYDVPWKDMHQALIDAALRTKMILKEPKPFVLQTSLDDFYVSYQINVFTTEANEQAIIYSELHQNIQDACKERGIEIMSPHYNAIRDGNKTTIPS
jgi:small-conductance mechanosensitive channel